MSNFKKNLRKGLNINEILNVEITTEKLEECREAFDMYDKDEDEIITTTELVPALRALGFNTNRIVIRKILEHDLYSDDGVGKLNFEDFIRFVILCKRCLFTKNDMMKDLRLIDKDNDGRITKLELKTYLKSLKIPFSMDELDDAVNAASDSNNDDGVIDYEKFAELMCPRDIETM
ncbi:hypothetical protein PVAND_010296 [Polypedilum vanderplanki]|uniref:EF-hand domain-containing protein n=1 Tax=Polypedilum vanderplanki TaxID=319348 RepID=A0A9J6CG88_POLVA|nr:hypothetical protein PVAND_010296 [Polypedilum vanderplanki]